MAEGRHLAATSIDWASQAIGEAMYMHKLWILKWGGNDSLGSKINRKAHVSAELGISTGETGDDWDTISIVYWRVMIKEKFRPTCWWAHLECGGY